jgi:hypothetical protein
VSPAAALLAGKHRHASVGWLALPISALALRRDGKYPTHGFDTVVIGEQPQLPGWWTVSEMS